MVRNKLALNKNLNKLTSEWEIIVNVIVVLLAGYIIARSELEVSGSNSLIVFPLSSGRFSIGLLTIAGGIFLLDGATQITRGILAKTGSAPKDVIDTEEYTRGKYIGNLERLMVFAVVLLGSYETIGFIVAGKGLIRSKEFENRDFAEYFLIGTFSSTAIAVAVGLLVKLAMARL